MNRSSDPLFDGRIAAWLEGDPDRAPDQALATILAAVPSISQRRALRFPRRFNPMPNSLRLVATAALVGVLAVGAIYVNLPARNDVGGPTASPSPTPQPSPTPSPTPASLLDTSTWTLFTSSQYGFTLAYPADWVVDAADRAWSLDTDAADWLSPAMDDFSTPALAEGDGVRVSFWSVPFEYSTDAQSPGDVEAWIQDYCQAAAKALCAQLLDNAVPLCIEVRDCHPGLLIGPPLEAEVQAFFSGGLYDGQMVVATVWREESDPSTARYGGTRKLLEAFLSTLCVWPEDARPEAFSAAGPPCLGANP